MLLLFFLLYGSLFTLTVHLTLHDSTCIDFHCVYAHLHTCINLYTIYTVEPRLSATHNTRSVLWRIIGYPFGRKPNDGYVLNLRPQSENWDFYPWKYNDFALYCRRKVAGSRSHRLKSVRQSSLYCVLRILILVISHPHALKTVWISHINEWASEQVKRSILQFLYTQRNNTQRTQVELCCYSIRMVLELFLAIYIEPISGCVCVRGCIANVLFYPIVLYYTMDSYHSIMPHTTWNI